MTITDESCWMCGNDNPTSMHHAIPKHYFPTKNVVIPICVKCHRKLNDVDYKGIECLAFKLVRHGEELVEISNVLLQRMENADKDDKRLDV
jgi:hypothetical protein